MRLLKFYQENCAPCKSVDTFLKNNDVEFQDIHAFDQAHLSAAYAIGSVPTLILLNDDGNEVGRSIGFKPEEIKALVSQFLI
ncbi:thioredoxin family protein [Paenibacillus lautus]|uniref:thioredoxin family protein n=1 Tax=Paenibacillus lautus TaxID=1401 RepID=UPI001C7D5F57|nr:thioredoxin family protein [Paenibacillus lautus]MBX4152439.1 thioredoxin family protein [Paenibacillus lautus]